jgi:hypothetical protein
MPDNNGPPPPYYEALAKPNPNMIQGHVLQTPLGPVQPHVDQIKPARGEFISSAANPYASPKQNPSPQSTSPYPSDSKEPLVKTSQLESGYDPYPQGTYPSNIGSGTRYQNPPQFGSGAPPGYQNGPQPRYPSQGPPPLGAGTGPRIYNSINDGGQPPYPINEPGMGPHGMPQRYPMPRPIYSNADPNMGMGQMNISGSPNNYPSSRLYGPYQNSPTIGSVVSQGYPGYQSPPTSMIGRGTIRGYSPPNPTIGSGTHPGYSPPNSRYQSPSPHGGYLPPGGPGYSSSRGYPTPYNTPMGGNYPPPMMGYGNMSSSHVGYGSTSSHGGYCSPCKPHHSHHHHHC